MIDELVGFTAKAAEFELTGVNRAQILYALTNWFEATPKRQVPDLEARVVDFKKQLAPLAAHIRLKFVRNGSLGSVVAEAEGADAATLAQVRAGTLWFDGWRAMELELMCILED